MMLVVHPVYQKDYVELPLDEWKQIVKQTGIEEERQKKKNLISKWLENRKKKNLNRFLQTPVPGDFQNLPARQDLYGR